MSDTMDTETRRAALFARTSTGALIRSVLLLDIKGAGVTSESRLIRAWVCDEIERRHPEVTPAMEAWVDDSEGELSYVEALVAALPESVVSQ